MTNEEKLKKILKETFPNVIFIWGISQERKEVSIHMSANWLEDSYTEKEQEPCEDCISRAELIDKTIKRNNIWLKITDSRGMNLQEIIDELPSIQPKQKTGHWIYRLMEGQFCSECDKPCLWKFNYCPNCGCRMVESQESEDKE